MINNKKHIIFDWNGTLVDDAWVFVDVLNQLLVPRGLNKITLKEYRGKFCFPIKSFYKQLGVDVSDESFDQLEKEFVNEYDKRMFRPELFDGVLVVLEKLINRGIGLSILSASNEVVLLKLVEHYALTKYFDFVVGVNNYGASGKIERGRRLVKILNLDEQKIVLVGDTDYDYEVSSSLQLDCILKINGHQSLDRLKMKTNVIINSIEDLITDKQ